MRKHYTVAGHGFTVDAEEAVFSGMEQYEPFLDEENTDSLFTLYVQESATPTNRQATRSRQKRPKCS